MVDAIWAEMDCAFRRRSRRFRAAAPRRPRNANRLRHNPFCWRTPAHHGGLLHELAHAMTSAHDGESTAMDDVHRTACPVADTLSARTERCAPHARHGRHRGRYRAKPVFIDIHCRTCPNSAASSDMCSELDTDGIIALPSVYWRGLATADPDNGGVVAARHPLFTTVVPRQQQHRASISDRTGRSNCSALRSLEATDASPLRGSFRRRLLPCSGHRSPGMLRLRPYPRHMPIDR